MRRPNEAPLRRQIAPWGCSVLDNREDWRAIGSGTMDELDHTASGHRAPLVQLSRNESQMRVTPGGLSYLIPCVLSWALLSPVSVSAIDPVDIVHHWSFNGSGEDSAGDAGAILVGGASYSDQDAAHGTHSLDLSTIGDRLDADGAALAFDGNDNWAVSVWINPRSSPGIAARIFSTALAGTGSFTAGVNLSGVLNTEVTIGGSVSPPFWSFSVDPSAAETNWQHVVVSNDGGTGSVYVDGVLRFSPLDANTPSATSFSVGNVPADLGVDRHWDGRIDELTIFDRALGVTEVAELYNDPGLASSLLVGFVRGECNQIGAIDLADAVTILNYTFGATPTPGCERACDTDDSGSVNIADAIFLLVALFEVGAPPPSPFPDCGPDRTDDQLTCQTFIGCP